jgi:hypothetical protein
MERRAEFIYLGPRIYLRQALSIISDRYTACYGRLPFNLEVQLPTGNLLPYYRLVTNIRIFLAIYALMVTF